MRNGSDEVFANRSSLFLALVMICGLIVLAGTYPGSRVRGAGAAAPHVTAITQVTHDGHGKTDLVADNSQVYVTELSAANRVIARVSLPESNLAADTKAGIPKAEVATRLTNPRALDLSPDHSKLLVSSKRGGSKQGGSGDSEFWILPVGKGSPVRVGNLTGRDASWSVDGQQLVFAKGSVLYLASAAGAKGHELYEATGSVFAPRFSPDGQRVRFTVSNAEQNTTALWEVGRDGSNPHALLGSWQYKGTACCGSWTADGRYYIFQASQTLPNTTTVVTKLWALSGSSADEEPVELTSGPMSFGNAVPAPDTKKIWAIGVRPEVEVVKYLPEKNRFVPVIAGLSATDLDYSPDGKWVAYVAIPEGTLWRSRADGSERLQLTSPTEHAALPRWSPDGKQIAYVSMKAVESLSEKSSARESWKLYLVAADGGDPQALLSERGSQIDANWSPDGTRLMFGDFNHDAAGLSIRIFDFKSHTAMKVPGSEGLFSPRWSPDGRYVAALSPDNTALMLFDFESGKWAKWTTSAGAVNYPVWSADSQYLYFDDLVDGAEAIRRVKVGQSAAEQVFVLGSLERYMGMLGIWSGRAVDGSWMFVRDRSTQEVYQLSLALP